MASVRSEDGSGSCLPPWSDAETKKWKKSWRGSRTFKARLKSSRVKSPGKSSAASRAACAASKLQGFHCLNRHFTGEAGKAFHLLLRFLRATLAPRLRNSSRHFSQPHAALLSKNWYTERTSGRDLHGKVRTSSESPTKVTVLVVLRTVGPSLDPARPGACFRAGPSGRN